MYRVLHFAMLNRSSSDNQSAVSYSVSQDCELFGICEHISGGADGGTGLAKRRLKRTHHPQMQRAEVAHGARGRAQVERVSRSDQHDTQPVER